ncbi:MAG: peptidyl-tRNA hydrolase Pth2 [archaeon]
MGYKQVILVRNDLKLPPGKLAAQVAHASVAAVGKSKRITVGLWNMHGAKKVVLKAANLEELEKYEKQAKRAKLVTSLISDAGKTVLKPGTTTCLAIGPFLESAIDKITGHLKVL